MRLSTIQEKQRPYAIVIGLDSSQGLQTARILADRQVPVIGIARDPNSFRCRTQVCEQIFFADTKGAELIFTLEALGPTLSQKAVLYPCTDMSVLLISRNHQKLKNWYHIVLPEPGVVEMLLDKPAFYTYAQEKGLPIPTTFLLKNRADAERAVTNLTFPCILKPAKKTPLWEQHVNVKVIKVNNAEAFLRDYELYSNWSEILIAQACIAGNDTNLYACNCYFNVDSQPVATFVSRKLRQYPPETGNGCLREECRNDTVLQETIGLFEGVGYRGLGYLEMMRDEHTGEYFIIEPNIGRPTGGSAIAEKGGVDLLYAMYCDTVGLPLPANLEQKYVGAKWIFLSEDIQSALHYWRRGELSLTEWWQSWRGPKAYAVFSWTDPNPFWGYLQMATGAMLKDVRNKIRQSVKKILRNYKQHEESQHGTI